MPTYKNSLLADSLVTAAEFGYNDRSTQVLTKGSGITGTGVVYKSSIERAGDLVYTRLYMDLTDLTAGGTTGDIIGGAAGAANSHIGQITAALSGTLVHGFIDVLETPGGGDTDIDLYTSTAATGAEDVAISGLAGQAIMCNAGAWSAGNRKILSAFPAANSYMYLVGIDGGNAAYTAGIFLMTLVGTA